jgi:hypothetical protein
LGVIRGIPDKSEWLVPGPVRPEKLPSTKIRKKVILTFTFAITLRLTADRTSRLWASNQFRKRLPFTPVQNFSGLSMAMFTLFRRQYLWLRTIAKENATEPSLALYYALCCVLIILIIHATCILYYGLFEPLIGKYNFRETQTALSAYWLWRGGPWITYETPVLGYPWAIPYEFPIYQWLVALLRLAGVPIDVGGRILTFAFYLGCLWPLKSLGRTLKLGRMPAIVVSILFMASPYYLFWSRAVLIESCALFFSILWLACMARFLTNPTPALGFATLVAGSLAVLAKSTTFPAFLFMGGLLFLTHGFWAWRSRHNTPIPFHRLTVGIFQLALPLIVGFAWVAYTDHIKSENPFGLYLTSANLSQFTFGTLQQRFSIEFWRDVVLRALKELLGPGFVVATIVAGAGLLSRSYFGFIVPALIGFILPMLIFTNLHFHEYYQYANGIFILMAVGLGIVSLLEAGRIRTGTVALLVVIVGQIAFFYMNFAKELTADNSFNHPLKVALLAKAKTRSTDALLVFGEDWSSLAPYYSERKALVLPYWASAPLVANVLADPQKFLGESHFAGIISCTNNLPNYHQRAELIANFVAGREVIARADGCEFLAAQR